MLKWEQKKTSFNISTICIERKRQKISLNPSQDLNLNINNLKPSWEVCEDSLKWRPQAVQKLARS